MSKWLKRTLIALVILYVAGFFFSRWFNPPSPVSDEMPNNVGDHASKDWNSLESIVDKKPFK